MAAHVIVLANRTAAAPELIEALVHRSERGPIHATLVMPAAGPGTADRARECKQRLDAALEAWRAAGIERCEGVVCDPVPLEALAEVWDPLRHDEVIVCTLPGQSSKWLRGDLPHAVARFTRRLGPARRRARPGGRAGGLRRRRCTRSRRSGR